MTTEGFQKELEELINRHSIENGSNTPDFILAQYMMDCLNAFNNVTTKREKWYGREPKKSLEQYKEMVWPIAGRPEEDKAEFFSKLDILSKNSL